MCHLIYKLPTSSPKVFLALSLTSFVPSFMSIQIRRSACGGCQGYITLISYLNIRLNILSLILGYSLVHIYSFYFYVLCKWQYIEKTLTTIMCGGFFFFCKRSQPPLIFESRAIYNSPLRLLMHFNSFNWPILLSLEFLLLFPTKNNGRVWSIVNSPNPHGIKVNPLFPSISRCL